MRDGTHPQTPAGRSAIKASHGLSGDPRRLTEYYRDWARRYDRDVNQERYRGPAVAADVLLTLIHAYGLVEPAEVTVLDAGCGTGLSGAALADRGFGTIDGFDLSPEMIEEARRRGLYRQLAAGIDLNRPLPDHLRASYYGVLACGVFTLGHVEPIGLDHLLAAVRPGGFVVLSTRKSYFDGSGFEAHRRQLAEAGRIVPMVCLEDASYVSEEGAHYWAFRVPS